MNARRYSELRYALGNEIIRPYERAHDRPDPETARAMVLMRGCAVTVADPVTAVNRFDEPTGVAVEKSTATIDVDPETLGYSAAELGLFYDDSTDSYRPIGAA